MIVKEVGHLKNTFPGKTKKQSAWKEDWSKTGQDSGFYDDAGPPFSPRVLRLPGLGSFNNWSHINSPSLC